MSLPIFKNLYVSNENSNSSSLTIPTSKLSPKRPPLTSVLLPNVWICQLFDNWTFHNNSLHSPCFIPIRKNCKHLNFQWTSKWISSALTIPQLEKKAHGSLYANKRQSSHLTLNRDKQILTDSRHFCWLHLFVFTRQPYRNFSLESWLFNKLHKPTFQLHMWQLSPFPGSEQGQGPLPRPGNARGVS